MLNETQLDELGIPAFDIRRTEVVNVKTDKYDVYIGRPRTCDEDAPFGNPHLIGYCGVCSKSHTREECIAEFKKYFFNRLKTDIEFFNKVMLLKNKKLGCWCVPQKCHGHVIVDYLESL